MLSRTGLSAMVGTFHNDQNSTVSNGASVMLERERAGCIQAAQPVDSMSNCAHYHFLLCRWHRALVCCWAPWR